MKSKKEGVNLFYEDSGAGETLCLIHGFLENRSMWDSFMPRLNEKYRIIRVDLPGHGKSELLPNGNTMQDMATAINDILIALDLTNVKLVGHSMGGYVALAFAKAYPKKVNGILLLNSTPQADSEERKELREHGIDMAQRNYTALVSMSVTNLFSQQLRLELKNEIEKVKQQALQTPLEAYIACQKSMALREDLSDFWKQAEFKKSLILGREDGLINWNQLTEDLESSTFKIDVLEGGHMLHIENFKGVSSRLTDF